LSNDGPQRLRKLILRNRQSLGGIVMLAAAVRDLHRAYPGSFLTDVRTSCPALWQNNPEITPICDDDPEALAIDCRYRWSSTAMRGLTTLSSDRRTYTMTAAGCAGNRRLLMK
jgi:hypothetical protein